MTAVADRELWARAVAGEPECFGLIFDRHAGAVHAYCRARSYGSTGGESAADLVSVVFLEAWRRRQDVVLEGDSALPWLLGVARRVLLSRARSTRRHRAALGRMAGAGPETAVVADPADAIAERLDGRRRLDAVRAAFARLGDKDREVLLLCVWGGLDYAAAAVALGIPIGTVRSRLSRARARLVELVEET